MERLKVQTLSSSKSPAKSPKRPPPPLAARVKVAVRVRPPVASNGNEVPLLCISEAEPETGANADNVIQFKLDKTQKSFRFDHIFSPEATQAEAYKAALQPLLVSLLCGFNVTVLAYGQTGSGKTYTMGGAAVGSGNDDGLILRFLRDLFDALRNEASMKTTIKVSFLEIYCDEIRDLLVERARGSSQNGGRQSSGPKHTIHEDDNDVWIEGLQQVNVKTVNEALNLLKTGRQRQTVGAHALNDQSSRSHAVYTLEVSRAFANEIKRSKLTFVDLAGSERVKKTLLEGHGMKEGSHINIGLLALGNVINALGSRQRPLQRLNSTGVSGRGTGSGNVTPRHVPYRSSKLTRLLRDALGGNSVTLFMYAKITNSNETLNTLQYANRARSIQNKAQKNVEEAVTEDMIVDATSVDLVTEHRMTALYDQRSRQHQFVHRLRQHFRHLASLLDVDNQMNELSKYTLEHQLDSLQQHLTALERLAADRLWTRLQHRETAIENYAGVWSDKLAEIFLSDDQFEACTPWHTHREDHEFFQHRILAFILNGWISVTRSDLENEQLWLAL
ncbi:hypothetical protein PC113_g11011 [Phytophthora cactorum]|uniref:Kinesin-like protein n=1 Tax=Phytophthora cactorum TaxID=29920 RepID=A0A8T0Z456_9STRA|nr:hypothetical protein PC113_g11011 [Phytophthora cactorum]